jgi:hypothetical protein
MVNEILDILEDLNKAHLSDKREEFVDLVGEFKDAANIFAKHVKKVENLSQK